jgi:hypothetical protein
MTIQMGDKVKDKITGVTGTVTGELISLHIAHRVSVQPFADKDGKMSESWWFDTAYCELIESNVVTPLNPRPQIVSLGDKVVDNIHKIEGIVTSIATYLTGCRRVTVKPIKLNKDGTTPKEIVFDEPSLKVVKAKFIKNTVEDPMDLKATGGPPTRVERY